MIFQLPWRCPRDGSTQVSKSAKVDASAAQSNDLRRRIRPRAPNTPSSISNVSSGRVAARHWHPFSLGGVTVGITQMLPTQSRPLGHWATVRQGVGWQVPSVPQVNPTGQPVVPAQVWASQTPEALQTKPVGQSVGRLQATT